jgi:hypothetical protein
MPCGKESLEPIDALGISRAGLEQPGLFAAGRQSRSLEEQALDGKDHDIRERLAAVDRDDERSHCQQDPQRR